MTISMSYNWLIMGQRYYAALVRTYETNWCPSWMSRGWDTVDASTA